MRKIYWAIKFQKPFMKQVMGTTLSMKAPTNTTSPSLHERYLFTFTLKLFSNHFVSAG